MGGVGDKGLPWPAQAGIVHGSVYETKQLVTMARGGPGKHCLSEDVKRLSGKVYGVALLTPACSHIRTEHLIHFQRAKTQETCIL